MQMNLKMLALVGLAAVGLVETAELAQSRPIMPAENRYQPYTGALPLCADPAVLGNIQSRFADRESGYWNSALQIVSYDRIRENGYRSNGLDYIPRRYCTARAYMNDGRIRQVTYWVGENLGMIGWGLTWWPSWGVEWCVAGLDRNYAYGAACRAARH